MEITNLSDAEFKTLVIRMLKELTECSRSIREEMKVTLSKIKKNLQGTNSGGDEAAIQINDLEHMEKISIQPKQQEEKRIKNNNNKDSISCLWDISKHTNVQVIRMPDEEEEQEIENVFEKITTENFSNLMKEIDIQVQKAKSPKQSEHKEVHTKITS